MMSGLFVAPMMKTFFLVDIPSISVKIWLMTLSAAPPPSPALPPRALAMESSSSKKRTHGAACLACRRKKQKCTSYKQTNAVLSSPETSSNFVQTKALTLSKISLTLASDSPNHMVSSSGPLMEIKLAWHSLAMALANKVLPHPGGP